MKFTPSAGVALAGLALRSAAARVKEDRHVLEVRRCLSEQIRWVVGLHCLPRTQIFYPFLPRGIPRLPLGYSNGTEP
jgi:hypothetical protein